MVSHPPCSCHSWFSCLLLSFSVPLHQATVSFPKLKSLSSPDIYHMETVSYFPSLLLPLSGSFDIVKWIVTDSLTNTVPACISWCILRTNSVCINSGGVKCCGVILYNQYIYILSWKFCDITEICSSFDATFWTKTCSSLAGFNLKLCFKIRTIKLQRQCLY